MSSPISGRAAARTPWSPGSDTSCSSSPDRRAPGGRVGRDGFVHLGFERRGPRTILTERRFTLPLQAFEPLELDDSNVAVLLLLNPTGGILGGDRLETSVAIGAHGRVCLATAAATRVYRSAGPPGLQRFGAVLERGASLEYLPDHLIPSPGARLRQSTEVTLAADATLLLLHAWAVGRVARGELWRFDELESHIMVRDSRGLLLEERSVLDGARGWDGLGGTEGFPYVASFVAIAPSRDRWDDLAEELAARLDAECLGARFAVTPLGRGGLLARLLCSSAPVLGAAVQTLWRLCRLRLLGLGPLWLRKL